MFSEGVIPFLQHSLAILSVVLLCYQPSICNPTYVLFPKTRLIFSDFAVEWKPRSSTTYPCQHLFSLCAVVLCLCVSLGRGFSYYPSMSTQSNLIPLHHLVSISLAVKHTLTSFVSRLISTMIIVTTLCGVRNLNYTVTCVIHYTDCTVMVLYIMCTVCLLCCAWL